MDIISSQYTNKYDDFNDNKIDMNNNDNDISGSHYCCSY